MGAYWGRPVPGNTLRRDGYYRLLTYLPNYTRSSLLYTHLPMITACREGKGEREVAMSASEVNSSYIVHVPAGPNP